MAWHCLPNSRFMGDIIRIVRCSKEEEDDFDFPFLNCSKDSATAIVSSYSSCFFGVESV
jgi:hypothetical protein